MVEWGVCGEGKEWEGLCVGMPSIARAAAGNDANPRLQPATSQTDNEHDASLPPASGQPPRSFSGSGLGLPDRMSARQGWKKFFFSPCSGNVCGLPWPPPNRPGKLRPDKHVRRACTPLAGKPPLPSPIRATSARHAAPMHGILPVPLPSRPCLPHLAYWHHRHDAGTKPSGGYG